MHIERVQVEEGFLDGLDVTLVPGLNVLIGARGTGKTSLIELIRFCLDVKGYSAETGKRSRDHALSVLGTGQVTMTLSDGVQKITVTRTASDTALRASASFLTPIIFSQTEIETVGLQDSFVGNRRQPDAAEAEAASEVRSLTAEAEALRREIDEFSRQISGLAVIDQQIAALASAEQQLAKASSEASEKKKSLDALSGTIASSSVAVTTIERIRQGITRWRGVVSAATNAAPAPEAWPAAAGNDPLGTVRERVLRARTYIQSALDDLARAEAETAELAHGVGERKIAVEEQARQLRKEIEALQAGAGAVTRQGQQLRERKAQLESLRAVSIARS